MSASNWLKLLMCILVAAIWWMFFSFETGFKVFVIMFGLFAITYDDNDPDHPIHSYENKGNG